MIKLIIIIQVHAITIVLLGCIHLVCTLTIISPIQKTSVKDIHSNNNGDVSHHTAVLDGDWEGSNNALQNPDCCVVSVPNLDKHLQVLQTYFVDEGPSDLDLRARVHVESSAYKDCLSIRQAVTPLATDDNDELPKDDPCTNALVELAKGVASLANTATPKEKVCEDVFIRIVCASNYQAIDPMYHTDKSPLRGYVTLTGVGTEFMTRVCSPIEYITLRGLGSGIGTLSHSIRQADELEFIVMKGDEYAQNDNYLSSLLSKIWKRRYACVHRSPPAAVENGGIGSKRRVIVSLDLADGDDREWYQIGTKREWRCGMTQRKSRLVA